MAEWPENICPLQSAIGDVVCLDLLTIVNLAFLAIFCLGVVAGVCALLIWQTRKSVPHDKKKSGKSGSIFFTLFAGVVMVGVLASSMNIIMRGPVTTMSRVTQRTIAEQNMLASGKLAIMAAANQPGSGDCDADNMVEPIAWSLTGTGTPPGGGGFLPDDIGASPTDPWGNTYGYCVWDHGTEIQTTCATPLLRLKGAAAANGPALAILSAGPDKIFQTSCADAPAYVVKAAASDDIVLPYGYAEAEAASGGLWNLKSGDPTIAEIAKDLEVKSQGGAVVFGVDSTTDAGRPSIKVDYIKALNNAKIEAVTRLLGSAGVEGATTNAANYGVFGSNTGAAGVAVKGLASNGTATGVLGQTSSTTSGAVGTKGEALATTGNTYGVSGLSKSSTGVGIYALADRATGSNYGVYGQSQSTTGTGVYGYGSAATGGNFGVFGRSNSAAGYGGYFDNAANGWGLFSVDDVGQLAGTYLNWGTTRGAGGYGLRDNAGTMEAKNSGGTWTSLSGAPLPNCSENEVLVTTGAGWDCLCLNPDSGEGGTWIGDDIDEGGPRPSVTMSADDAKLVITYEGASIITSTDSGVTWTDLGTTNRNWVDVASSADGTKLVAVVDNGQIYTSTNSGVSWTARDGNRDWTAVASSADGTKLVATVDYGQIYTSTNSGVSWTARASDQSWRGVASSVDGTKLVAVVDNGRIYTSTNSGVSWTARNSSRAWMDVASSADGTKLVALADGESIYTSTDSGVSWTARASGKQWIAVASSADGTRLVAVTDEEEAIWTSMDSGVTWTVAYAGDDYSWEDVAMSADGTRFIAVSHYDGSRIYTFEESAGSGCLPP
jgi:photosystem II stability/assembly factor-like uncharacterized protein